MAIVLQAIDAISAPEVDEGAVRTAQDVPAGAGSVPGSAPLEENEGSQIHASRSSPVQDVVKVQLEPPGETAVYQFVDQQGTLVLQVPPQQLLDLAQQISQELARKPPSQVPAEGGRNHGR